MSDKTAWQKLLKAYLDSCTKEDAISEEQIYKDFASSSVSDDVRFICKTTDISENNNFIYVEDDKALIFTDTTCVEIQELETEVKVTYHEKLKVKDIIFEPRAYALEPVRISFVNNRNEEVILEKQRAMRNDNFEKLIQTRL